MELFVFGYLIVRLLMYAVILLFVYAALQVPKIARRSKKQVELLQKQNALLEQLLARQPVVAGMAAPLETSTDGEEEIIQAS